MPYNEVTDLNRINACAVKKQKQADYYRCFVSEENESGGMPLAKQSKSSRPAR
jgi:hypothetical protein